jgi:signal transduction histidine kinase
MPSSRLALVWLMISVLLGCGVLLVFHRQLAGSWLVFGVHPDVLALLEQSMEDQKLLARDHPGQEQRFRQRFEATRETLSRLRILRHSRQAIIRRYELVLLALFGGTVVLTGAGYVLHQRRNEARLQRLQLALTELSLGHAAVEAGDRRRDTIGRIAGMIEQTSRVMGADRRRLAALRHLESWQEAACRQAHEMRTPLTAARIELRRLGELVADPAAAPGAITERLDRLRQEMTGLEGFVQRFSSFARLARAWHGRARRRSTSVPSWPSSGSCTPTCGRCWCSSAASRPARHSPWPIARCSGRCSSTCSRTALWPWVTGTGLW